jgi:hypothetical protein
MNRVFHDFNDWEDRKNGMYKYISLDGMDSEINSCIRLLVDKNVFYETMVEMCNEWNIAAETNLTFRGNNRRAWLGRASCCYALKVPENIVQKAWKSMSKKQRLDANKTADKFLLEWEKEYAEKNT